jgi:RNA-dependent RNA polymerase
MHRQGHLRPQDGHGGSGNHDSSGSSDGLAYSSSFGGTKVQARLARPVVKPSTSGNRSSDGREHSSSSGGTNRQARLGRPVVKPSSSPVNRVTPEQSHTTYGRSDSSMSPGRPNREEHTSFTLNGQQINETWKPRPNAFTGPAQLPTPMTMSSAKMTSRPLLRAETQHAWDGQTPHNNHSQWASQQESKVRVLCLPKHWWTQDVYHAMSRFGTVVRIEMENGSRNNGNRDNNAWVSFQ